jgi:hypothetical protein
VAFKMVCPKCGGLDYRIERDRRTSYQPDDIFALIFSCRCGKQMFGQVLLDEYEGQKRSFEQGRSEAGFTRSLELDRPHAGEVRPPRHEPPPMDEDDDHDHDHGHDDEEDDEDDDTADTADDEDGDEVAGDKDETLCAWAPCLKPRRPRSKYCSRECSNKNARSRHKTRKPSPRTRNREAA